MSLGCRSIFVWADKSEQTKASTTAREKSKDFMVSLFFLRIERLATNSCEVRRSPRRAPVVFDFDVWHKRLYNYSQFVTTICENLERVRSQIADAAQKSGRSPDAIELVAISKTHDADKVRAAHEAGQTLFGESRVQEARAKIPELPSSLRWHFVGHLQKNKIRHALPLFELFHGIDSLDLARDLNRMAEEDGMHPRILLEVNVAGEGSKFGFKPETLRQEMEQLLSLGRVSIEGLMTIPPLAEEAEASRKFFVDLRELRNALKRIRYETSAALDGHDERFSGGGRGRGDARSRRYRDLRGTF